MTFKNGYYLPCLLQLQFKLFLTTIVTTLAVPPGKIKLNKGRTVIAT